MGTEAETVLPAHSAGRRRLSGALLVALSAAGFGAMPIFARQAYAAGVDLYGILLPRFAIAGVLLALLAVLRGARMPPWRHVVMLALLGGVGYAGQSMLYYSALHYASAGLVALLLYAYPFLVAILAAIFLREHLGLRQFVALPIAAIGLVLTIGGGTGSALGAALALGAAAVYSIYIVGGTRVMRQVDPLAASGIVCGAAAVSLALVALVRVAGGLPLSLPHDAAGAIPVLLIALVSTVLSITGLLVGLKWLGASLTSVISTLEPVVSVLLGALVLHEVVTTQQALGGAIVLAAAIWLALEPPRNA
jgi:drug/metabolite transporter (DMT)-like permease